MVMAHEYVGLHGSMMRMWLNTKRGIPSLCEPGLLVRRALFEASLSEPARIDERCLSPWTRVGGLRASYIQLQLQLPGLPTPRRARWRCAQLAGV